MVQEFIPGETLQERLRRLNKTGRLMSIADAIRYTIHISEASGYAHKRGMIHRDIKPANIMLDIHDQAILMDFGIVKILGGEKHTATGAVVGTALYMPPEVIRGEIPDARSDLYSLGITLYEMICGKPPFEADSAMSLLMMHLNDPLPDLRNLRPDLPAELIQVMEKSLAKQVSQRYLSMKDFANALLACNLESPSQPQATVVSTSATAGVILASKLVPTDNIQTMDEAGSPFETKEEITQSDQTALNKAPSSDAANQPKPASILEDSSLASPAENEKTLPGSEGMKIDSTNPPAGPTLLMPAQEESSRARQSQSLPPSELHPGEPTATQFDARMNQPGLLLARKIPWAIFGGAAILLLLVIIGTYWIISRGNANIALPETSPTHREIVAALLETTPTEAATATTTKTVETPPLQETRTSTPPATPTIKPSPTVTLTPTIPAGVPFVVIQRITVNDQGRYVVEYETFEYSEKLPGQHVHFFFNTVPPDQAGNPGKGPWKLYGGPRPFEGYRQVDRPENATQMCALVANPNHSVQLESGPCMILPDVNVTAPYEATACLEGPDPVFAVVTQLEAGQLVQIKGLSPDEAWWNVFHPENQEENCWILRSAASFQGDLSSIVMVEEPAPPAGSAQKQAAITNITLDGQGNYVVEYRVEGFEEKLPGTHLHFFFDVFSAEQTGPIGSGNRLMYEGPSPFSGYNQTNRPEGAENLCVLVANPDHTVIEGSGNCYPLP
jgi:serine/threonine protein kinase